MQAYKCLRLLIRGFSDIVLRPQRSSALAYVKLSLAHSCEEWLQTPAVADCGNKKIKKSQPKYDFSFRLCHM